MMTETRLESISITEAEADMRLDRMLRKRFAGLSQGVIEKQLRTGTIRVDGNRVKASHRLAVGEDITMPPKLLIMLANAHQSKGAGKSTTAKPARPVSKELIATLRHAIIRETDEYIALNKPSGLAVQGGTGTHQHIDGALSAAFPGGEKPLLVHRLDRDTSGVLVVAKTAQAARHLAKGFQSRQHDKIYLALVLGKPTDHEGVIQAPLLKSGGYGNEKMVVDFDDGQKAETAFTCLDTIGGKVSLMMLEPWTGRTHQLRAHMLAMGCPILGDGKYGGAEAFPNAEVRRLCLHAVRLDLDGSLPLIADLPADLLHIMRFFGFDPAVVMAMIREMKPGKN
jgi:23S rRNA pseudouridine955/2504/2580 synthase